MTTGTKTSSQIVGILPDDGVNHGELKSVTTTYKTWTGTDNPAPSLAPKIKGLKKGRKFKRQRRTRDLGEHAYSKSGFTVNSGVARCSQLFSKWETVWYNSTCQNVPALKAQVSLDPSQEYKLLEKLRRRVYGSGFNPAIFAAEMPKALEMIYNAAVRIGAGLHRLRSGDWHGVLECFGIGHYGRRYFRPATKDLSSLWLEISYGWKPLLSDVKSAADYIGEALNGGHAGVVRASRSWQQTIAGICDGVNALYHEFLKVTHTLSYKIKAVSVAPWYVGSLATVEATAWEILPYSFVCDWFVPVGDYLQALRTSSDISGTVIRSYKREYTYGRPVSGNPSGFKLQYLECGDFHRRDFDFTRTISTEIVPPSPVDGAKLEAFSAMRTANAVSLLVQRDWSALNKLFSKK